LGKNAYLPSGIKELHSPDTTSWTTMETKSEKKLTTHLNEVVNKVADNANALVNL
jgi:hypothetical protein